MALVEVTLDCTGTGTATTKSDPSIIKSCTGTSVPTVQKIPSRSLQAIGTAVSFAYKIPGKVFTSQASTNLVISLIRFGADAYDVLEAKRKWFVSEAGRWSITFQKKFGLIVRGRPGG